MRIVYINYPISGEPIKLTTRTKNKPCQLGLKNPGAEVELLEVLKITTSHPPEPAPAGDNACQQPRTEQPNFSQCEILGYENTSSSEHE